MWQVTGTQHLGFVMLCCCRGQARDGLSGWKGCWVIGTWKRTWSPQFHSKLRVSVLFASLCPLLCHITPWSISCPSSSVPRGYLSFGSTLQVLPGLSVKMSWDSLNPLNHRLIKCCQLKLGSTGDLWCMWLSSGWTILSADVVSPICTWLMWILPSPFHLVSPKILAKTQQFWSLWHGCIWNASGSEQSN